jgi:hypothetical protein
MTGFTIGDSVDGLPGHDNYVADNVVSQTGGVPPGVFGSTGNTLLERNCLPTGIQAYAYNGPFDGVTIQYNLIEPGWFAPDTDVIAGWDTNTFTDGGDCPAELRGALRDRGRLTAVPFARVPSPSSPALG